MDNKVKTLSNEVSTRTPLKTLDFAAVTKEGAGETDVL